MDFRVRLLAQFKPATSRGEYLGPKIGATHCQAQVGLTDKASAIKEHDTSKITPSSVSILVIYRLRFD